MKEERETKEQEAEAAAEEIEVKEPAQQSSQYLSRCGADTARWLIGL
jgi:hypothetical protein